MSPSRKRGFATLSPAQRKAVSRKGGKAKVSKGFATMSPERLSEVGRKGALARLEKKRKEQNNEQNSIPDWDEGNPSEE